MRTPITHAEFNAYKETCDAEHRRLADEDSRQNHRIESLEGTVKEILGLTTSVERLATNMENMLKEQQEQGKRLTALEDRDGDLWRSAVKYVLSAVIGGVIVYLLKNAGIV